jgi:hypothetical protein
MRSYLAARFRGWANWLAPQVAEAPRPHQVLADALVAEAEQKWPGTSGEHKRHQVYSQLIKAFPGIRRRDLGLAIELAIQRS